MNFAKQNTDKLGLEVSFELSVSKEAITRLVNISRSKGLGLVFWDKMANYELGNLGVGYLTQHSRCLR